MTHSWTEDRVRRALDWRLRLLLSEDERVTQSDSAEAEISADWEEIRAWLSNERTIRDGLVTSMTVAVFKEMKYAFTDQLGLVSPEELEKVCEKVGLEKGRKDLKHRWNGLKTNVGAGDVKNMIAFGSARLMRALQENYQVPSVQMNQELQHEQEANDGDAAAQQVQPPQPVAQPVTPVSVEFRVSQDQAAPEASQPPAPVADIPCVQENANSREPDQDERIPLAQPQPPETARPELENPETTPESPETTLISRPVSSAWKYLPVPEGPDKHEEFDSRSGISPEGMKIIGARVRGKKHKHEGTNCDDWYEFVSIGPWTIIAVSDGAGSKKFSRVGAEVSCKEAVRSLTSDLKHHEIRPRDVWSVDTFRRSETDGTFAEADLEFVQIALHRAMVSAYDAVVQAADERKKFLEYYKILGDRELNVKDLSATLLLAVHASVNYKERDYSFMLSCQVGDGITAAIDHQGSLRLLGLPDSGSFSGETDFLTSKKKLERMNLSRKTFPFFSPMQALMVMTDGVADDYFPNDPGIMQLYGDLVLNRVVEIKGVTESDMARALQSTKLPSLDAVKTADFRSDVERILADGHHRVSIRSAFSYGLILGIRISELIASPALLVAGSMGEPVGRQDLPEKRLETWLDSYQVRGSFDDRTLVIMFREVLA